MKKKKLDKIDEFIPAELISDAELDNAPYLKCTLISKPNSKGIVPTEGRILQALPVEERGPILQALPVEENGQLFYALPLDEMAKYVPNEENPIPCNLVPIDKRQGSWTNYAGDWEGYYFDPNDDCYYEGKAPVEVQKMYLPPAEKIIKKVRAQGAPLTEKPKEKRKAVKSFGLSDFYGQYAIGHNVEGEYFFTLYAKDNSPLFESHNYKTEQFCIDAVNRFKKHVIAGTFEITEKDGKFHYTLTRNINIYDGIVYATREEAENAVKKVKRYAQTDEIQQI